MIIKPYIQWPKLSKLKVGDKVRFKANKKEYIITSIEWEFRMIFVENHSWGGNFTYFEIIIDK